MRRLVAVISSICLLAIVLAILGGRYADSTASRASRQIEVASNTPMVLVRPQVFASENDQSWDVYLRDVTGTVQQLTHSFATERYPVLSPTEHHVAFVSWRDGNSEIYVLDILSGRLQNVSRHPGRDVLPVWSPDGFMLAFVSDRTGNHDVWVADVRRGLVQNLTRSSAHDTAPQWRADGLAFRSDRGGTMAHHLVPLRVASN